MSEARLLVCMPWDAPRYVPSIARKCACGAMCQVDATNAEALDRGDFAVVCANCALKDPRFAAELADGIAVLHRGRPILVQTKEDA